MILWTAGVICICAEYYRPRVYFTPGTDCEDNIIREIRRAHNIDIAVYAITNKNITDEIINAHNRGAHIRIISDRTMARTKDAAIGLLGDAGVPVITNTHNKIMHNKFAVFDSRRVVTGSYNWTANATRTNAENCVFTIAPVFGAHFNFLWKLYTTN